MAWRRSVVLLAFCLLPSAAAATAAVRPPKPDPFAACRERLAIAPNDYESSYCFFQVAQQQRLWDDGSVVFEGLMRAHPSNFWLPLAYGHAFRDRDPERAIALYRRAASGFRQSGNAAGEILARSNLRNYLFPRGRREEAEAELRRVSEVAATVTDPIVSAQAWTLEAAHLQDTDGDLAVAYRLLEQVRRAVFPGGPYRLRRTCLSSLGQLALRLGRVDEALASFTALDELAAAQHDAREQAAARYNLLNVSSMAATLLPTPGSRERLLRLAERTLEAGETAQHTLVIIKTHRTLAALLAHDAARRDEALRHVNACLALATEHGQPHDEAVCAWLDASLVSARARASERRAIDATVRSKSPVTQAFSAGRQMQLAWETKPRADAIRESLEAIDTIERLRRMQDDRDVSAELFSSWTLDYYWLVGRLLRDGGTADVELAFSIAERLRARSLVDRIAEPEGRGAEAAFASLDRVQARLGVNEALLSFQVGIWDTYEGEFGGGSWLIVATRERRAAYRIPDRAQLAPMIPVFNGLLARSDAAEAPAAARLYDDILGEALRQLPGGITRLIIAPDGPLHRLPFDALRGGPARRPLAALYETVVVPSATLWLQWRQHPSHSASYRALVLADPEQQRAGALPHARRESRAIARHLGGADVLVGNDASERALKARHLSDYQFVHVAAHAVADERRPEQSAVMLAADHGSRRGAESASEDGLLHAREIERLDLGGRIVVLSACETAAGTVLSGEGVLSLARAFFQAGARTVIGTRWAIRDQDAAALFEAFYRRVAAGATLSEAMTEAKREAMEDGRPASAWAGVVLIGDGVERPFPNGTRTSSRAAWLLALATMSLMMMLVIVRFPTRWSSPPAIERSAWRSSSSA